MSKNTVIIFDLDGTALDTNLLVEMSFRETFAHFRPDLQLSDETILSFLGPTLEESFGRYLREDEISEAVAYYRNYNRAQHPQLAKVYPGEHAALSMLKENGFPLAILTTKRQDIAEYGLSLFGLDVYFDAIIGMDRLTRMKPDPEGVYKIMDMTNTQHAIMVGDNVSDIKAGLNAGQTSIGVAWSTKLDDLYATQVEIADSFAQLAEMIIRTKCEKL